ncbi:TetR/AcrR family transcriptional regulator [Paenibacillus caui]|uniref:TetR/AcrR family transcriptional regulator n=1 Tax=Paenibacillus caui TaxID=2873927 RepID=UPI001CA8467F|nr:TetR/AcrR family transcriptional regulator [Paenibacillus caui]
MAAEKKKRTYDAARTKEIILNAAEELFAEHGYSAARIDAIAQKSGYNKSLIYQYFQDKLGLYTEVVKRADQLGDSILRELIGDLLTDESVPSDPVKFRRLLEMLISIAYQFMVEHPRYLKIYAWEAAEEFKTWNQIAYRPDDISEFYKLAKAAKENGIIRKDIDAFLLPIMMWNSVSSFIQSYSRLKDLMEEIGEPLPQERAKEQIVKLVIYGVMEPSLL